MEKLQQPLLYMRKHSYTFPITEKEGYMSSSGFLTTVSASVAHDPECEDMSTNKGCKTLFWFSILVRCMIMLSFNDTRAYELWSRNIKESRVYAKDLKCYCIHNLTLKIALFLCKVFHYTIHMGLCEIPIYCKYKHRSIMIVQVCDLKIFLNQRYKWNKKFKKLTHESYSFILKY